MKSCEIKESSLIPLDVFSGFYACLHSFVETLFFDPREDIQILYEYNGFLTEC